MLCLSFRKSLLVPVDGEVFVSVDTPAEDYDFSKDPVVLADFKASEWYRGYGDGDRDGEDGTSGDGHGTGTGTGTGPTLAERWESFWSAWRVRVTTAVRDAFMADPVLADPTHGVLRRAKFTMYQVRSGSVQPAS